MAKKGNRATPLTKDLIWVVAVVIALVAFYGFLISIVGSKNSLQLINVLVWPTVVVIVLIVFRKPLADFLLGIAGRVTKFSITQFFAVELSLPDVSSLKFADLEGTYSKQIPSGEVGSDSLRELLQAIEKDKVKALDYVVVDLDAEQKWLTSRLFIFTLILKRMRGLRCVVFQGTRCNVPQSFVGIALADEVRWELARQYPWLEVIYNKAYTTAKSLMPVQTQSKRGELTIEIAAELVGAFAHDDDMRKDKTSSPDPSEWVCVEKGAYSYWEHAKWIDEACLKNDLGGALRTSEEVWYEDSLDTSKVRRAQALLRRKGPFVALIDGERIFRGLVDREALLEEVAERVEQVLDDQLPAKRE